MKNEKITRAFEGISPSPEAEARMLEGILGKREERKKRIPFKALVPAAAALLLVLGLSVFFLGNRSHTITLTTGETLRFTRTTVSAPSLDMPFPYEGRALTQEEKSLFFGDAADVSATGFFTLDGGSLERIEAELGETRVYLVKEGLPVTDTVIEGEKSNSLISEIEVKSSFFVTGPNSRGVRTAIYAVSFCKGEIQVYLELAGDVKESARLETTLANLILDLIQRDFPAFSDIAE